MTWMSQFDITSHMHGKMTRCSGTITLLETPSSICVNVIHYQHVTKVF